MKRAEENIVDSQEKLESIQRKRKLKDIAECSKIVNYRKKKKLLRQVTFSKVQAGNSEKFDVATAKRSAKRRKNETLEACSEIHGATDHDQGPALDGMWCTLINASSPDRMSGYISQSLKIRKRVLPTVVKKEVKKFEDSTENLLRSIKVLYSGGLLSKEKYKAIRINLTMSTSKDRKQRAGLKFMSGVALPKLLPYDKLISYIKTIDFNENIKDMTPEFCSDMGDSDVVNGAYRELNEFLLKLAEMYVEVDKALGSESFLNHFGMDKYHFGFAIGADGAPFGKDDEATAWLVSCLNVGSHITSESENFLLAGANCSESHLCMERYAKKLVHDMDIIANKDYQINGLNVKFSFELLPSDMKWLASMGGELSNAAYYFSSFGNVCEETKATVNGSLGKGDHNTWQPWSYQKRLEVAAKVAERKQQLQGSTYAGSTKRKKVLDFIKDQKSRQEFEPIIGKIIDFGYAEPLHNGNNAWQFWHSFVLEIALSKSQVPQNCNELSKLPLDCPFICYIDCLKGLGLSRLAKKVRKWFTEGRKKTFDYKFTGKETKTLCQNFMSLINVVSSDRDLPETKLKTATLAYCGLQLRDSVSLFSRVETNQAEISKLKTTCQHFFNANSLLLRVSPTVWTIGYAIPYHAQILYDKYGLGLGINSMQGREAKHVRLSHYSRHATLTGRWKLVLRHDYITCVWIRREDPFHSSYVKSKEQYIPSKISSDGFCYCGFPKEERGQCCKFCSSSLYRAVAQSAASGILTAEICNLASVTA